MRLRNRKTDVISDYDIAKASLLGLPGSGDMGMDKQAMRAETERLIREAMEKKKVVVKQGNTRIEAKCGKCGAPNRVQAAKGETRVTFACKECGTKQQTL